MELPTPSALATVTVGLNALSTILLLAGYRAIRGGNRFRHARLMVGALIASTAFLAVYLVNHGLHGSTRYPLKDWTYTLYLVILIPHIILATLMVPFILRGVYLAWRQRFEHHARLMQWVWPVWLYVSVTGVLVYLMLYVLPGMRA